MAQPEEIFRKDYQPCPYTVETIYLDFDLHPERTLVTSKCEFKVTENSKNSAAEFAAIELDGENSMIKLVNIEINSESLSEGKDFIIDSNNLVINTNTMTDLLSKVSDLKSFEVTAKVEINPTANTALAGLYKEMNSPTLCTQCEAMGFRRITYYYDRPDILAKYTVRLEGDKSMFPILLSNGNMVKSEELANGRHSTLWVDPFPKPSYLFALVAGDLGSISDTFTTMSGRVIKLGVYSEKENVSQLHFAMESLKKAMKWDEDTFGLECDLDVFNIVATNDFNMGAMENKGLNIFNAAALLIDSEVSSDSAHTIVQGIVAHEYFHNWTGNRVTLRDWFQLTLKEGLTVFRDQWFTSDHLNRTIKRINDVAVVRRRQFAEDAGPMAHPIRPDSYISMDNFYTVTVYRKGAEVIGIYKSLLGEDGFKKGMKLYFERHDGSAATCVDFRNAMADANNIDLSQLESWYSQKGTPTVDIATNYDSEKGCLKLTARQSLEGLKDGFQPFLIPIITTIFNPSTSEVIGQPSRLLKLTAYEQTFEFNDVPVSPIISTLQNWSAPVKLNFEQSEEDLIFLMENDNDGFNKCEASYKAFTKAILSLVDKKITKVSTKLIEAIRKILRSAADGEADLGLISQALQLPTSDYLITLKDDFDIDGIFWACKVLKTTIATELVDDFNKVYNNCSKGGKVPYEYSTEENGRRALRTTCLTFLSSAENYKEKILGVAKAQYEENTSVTERTNALSVLLDVDNTSAECQAVLADYYDRAKVLGKKGNIMLNGWFSIQAMADYPELMTTMKQLIQHPDFTLKNPNRARSVYAIFASNFKHFHAIDGSGYVFIADFISEVDKLNPQVAARMTTCFAMWKKFDTTRKSLMRKALESIAANKLSKDTFELVTKYLS